MDKLIGLIAVICVGMLTTLVTFKISEVMDDSSGDTELYDGDSDIHIYVPSRCRHRGGDNGQDMENEG